MEQKTIQLLFSLLRFAINGTPMGDEEKALYSEERLPELLEIAKKHDLLHLVCLGLKQNFPVHRNDVDMKKSIISAVYRYEQQNFELNRMCDALEQAKIPFMPLKGSVIRRYYPEPWMRTSVDIDVLVHEADAECAAAVLVETCGYEYLHKGGHDIGMATPGRKNIELHYNLIDDGLANRSSVVLKAVWDTSRIRDGYGYWNQMPDEMFYFYHIAHMAKHVEFGGCGIRPFMDLWILDRMEEADRPRRDELLRQGNLLKFAESARKLSAVWFGGQEMDPRSRQMEDYILRGGVFGNSENRILVQQQKKGGKLRYVLSRVFLSYDEIKFLYPVLQRHRWLTPLMQFRRWLGWIWDGAGGTVLRKLKISTNVSTEQADSAKDFLNNIGL